MSLKLKAKSYRCRFLEPGVSNNGGVAVLIRSENLMHLANKFKGVPFIIDHEDIDVDNIDNKKVGLATDIIKDDDGWAWCNYMIDSEEAEMLLKQGHSISCAYTVLQKGDGGVYNGVEYDFEVLDLEPDHIAIVAEPHYTGAIVVENSKKNINAKEKIKNMFNFLKKNKKEEIIKNSLEEVENAYAKNGEEEIAVADLVKNYQDFVANKKEEEKKEEEKKPKKEILNADDEVEVDGKMVAVKDLLEAYNSCKRKNEEEGDKKDDKDSKDAKQENEGDKDEKKDKEVENEDKAEEGDKKKDEDKEVKNESDDDEDCKKVKNAKQKFIENADYKEQPKKGALSDIKKAQDAIMKIYSSCPEE